MKTTSIYYSVANHGDGSAYPKFFYEKAVAEIHQDMEEEWGESCTGSLEIEHEGELNIKGCVTRATFIAEIEERLAFYQQHNQDQYSKKWKTALASLR